MTKGHKIYPARYADKFGTEKIEIYNNGEELSMIIRGVTFNGGDFDDFAPASGTLPNKLKKFSFDSHQTLVDHELECEIPIAIGKDDTTMPGLLKMKLILGEMTPTNRISKELLFLELDFKNMNIKSSGKSDWFEDEMLDIQKQLPSGYYFKCCFGCLYSDYSVYGHGLFGHMLCFRNFKEDYLAVKDKDDYLKIMNNTTIIVQEIYLCSEFKKRIPKTGYRG